MANEFVVVKILTSQPDERLSKMKICGSLQRVPVASLDEKNKSIEVLI
jgi:hypothetical protein